MTRDYGDGYIVEVNEFATGERGRKEINDAFARGDYGLVHYLERGYWPRRRRLTPAEAAAAARYRRTLGQ